MPSIKDEAAATFRIAFFSIGPPNLGAALSLKFRRIGPRGPKKGAVAQVSTNWDRQRDENPNIDGNSGASREATRVAFNYAFNRTESLRISSNLGNRPGCGKTGKKL
jgi:hypothetical protein